MEKERGITITNLGKKETIEEAAQKNANQFIDGKDHYYGFMAGAQWQLQQQDAFAIGFAEFLQLFTQEFEDGDLRYWNKDKWERKSMSELLEIYKNQLPK